jgi:hypothetical protein
MLEQQAMLDLLAGTPQGGSVFTQSMTKTSVEYGAKIYEKTFEGDQRHQGTYSPRGC